MSSTLYKIFPTTVHTFRKLYSSVAALNLNIRNFLKLSARILESSLTSFLSVMERFIPFNLFLLLKNLRLSEYLANFTIIGRRLFSDDDFLSDESGQYSLHRYLYPFLI